VHDLAAREDLRRPRDRAQPRREVQRAAAEPVTDRDGFTGVEPDPDGERPRRIGDRLVHEPALKLDRRADRLPGRAEDGERLVTAELDELALPGLDARARDLGEPRGELRRRLVAVLVREDGVAADVRDQERADDAAGLRGSFHRIER
jgi:hypothetical protein